VYIDQRTLQYRGKLPNGWLNSSLKRATLGLVEDAANSLIEGVLDEIIEHPRHNCAPKKYDCLIYEASALR